MGGIDQLMKTYPNKHKINAIMCVLVADSCLKLVVMLARQLGHEIRHGSGPTGGPILRGRKRWGGGALKNIHIYFYI